MGGLIKVCKRMCGTCIFRPDSPLADRVEAIDPDWRERDTYQVCHDFAIGGDGEEGDPDHWTYNPRTGRPTEPVICRGFYEQRYLTEGIGALLRFAQTIEDEKEGAGFEFVERTDDDGRYREDDDE